MVRRWFLAAVGLWGLAVALAVLGYALDADAFSGLSVAVRRAAVAVSLLWALLAAVAAAWRRVRG